MYSFLEAMLTLRTSIKGEVRVDQVPDWLLVSEPGKDLHRSVWFWPLVSLISKFPKFSMTLSAECWLDPCPGWHSEHLISCRQTSQLFPLHGFLPICKRKTHLSLWRLLCQRRLLLHQVGSPTAVSLFHLRRHFPPPPPTAILPWGI